ncbi:rab11 family-interacting protein 4B-like [Prorops nasuta]|uniref:rab11 family-interacting protein 4B-like n=1 Tax=Prorops nasuta TaxID=863751 RepID=UPI0034CF2107
MVISHLNDVEINVPCVSQNRGMVNGSSNSSNSDISGHNGNERTNSNGNIESGQNSVLSKLASKAVNQEDSLNLSNRIANGLEWNQSRKNRNYKRNDSENGNGNEIENRDESEQERGRSEKSGQNGEAASLPITLSSSSLDLHSSTGSNLQDSGHYSTSPDRNDSYVTGSAIKFITKPSSEENYEAFGSIDGDDRNDSHAASSTTSSPTGLDFARNPRSPNSTIGRHSWLRTSLRRTPPSSGRKRLSSNALASQLYRSGSFNSLGKGPATDNTEDMYSDISLEDDVIDLSQKVQMIQEQVHALADTQSVEGERYARAKQENATLQARILMLEETAKDAEIRAEERLQAEQRRHREWASRLEREKQLQLENYAIKLQAVELESNNLREEIVRLREQLEKTKTEKAHFENLLADSKREAQIAHENERLAVSRANAAHNLLEAAKDEMSLRIEEQQKIEQLQNRLMELEVHNKSLEESRDELQAAMAVQAGRELLLRNSSNNVTEKGPSLAAELLAGINQDQADGHIDNFEDFSSISEIKIALKEQQEVNAQLRAYIDGILLNIVENHPQLLEVKQAH